MRKLILMAVHLLAIFSLAYAGNIFYVGAQKCKNCHSGPKNGNVYEKWEKAVHARAFETLKAKGEEKNPRCLACHVTGFNGGGYKAGAPDAVNFEGVQCEACHGKGSLYRKADIMKDTRRSIENGLLIPVEAVCAECHNKNSPSFKGFNYDQALKKIDHIYSNKPVREKY